MKHTLREYASDKGLRGKSRLRRYILLGVLLTGAVGLVFVGYRSWAVMKVLRLQQSLAEHVDPPTRVLYDDQPDRAAALLQETGCYARLPGFRQEISPVMREPNVGAMPWPPGVVLLYVHGVQTPHGKDVLLGVTAEISPAPDGSRTVALSARLTERKSFVEQWWRSHNRSREVSRIDLGPPLAGSEPLRIYAGQSTTPDFRGFSIPVEVGGHHLKIRGEYSQEGRAWLNVVEESVENGSGERTHP